MVLFVLKAHRALGVGRRIYKDAQLVLRQGVVVAAARDKLKALLNIELLLAASAVYEEALYLGRGKSR